jgi:hypothetical protein
MKKLLLRSGLVLSGLLVLTMTSMSPVYGMGWNPHHLQSGHHPQPGHDPQPGPQAVPEPSTLALIGVGVAGVGAYFYNKKRNRK